MTLVQRCPGRSWAQLVWLRASRPCQPPYMLACVACALPISVSRTLLCAPGLRDVHELTWAAVTQVSARAYVASLLGAKRGIPGRGGPSVAILGAKLPAQLSSSPAVLSQADPQVIFLPRPAPSRVMGPKISCSNSCSNPGPKPVATPPGGGRVPFIFPLWCRRLPQPHGDKPSSNPRLALGSFQRPGLGKARKTGTEPPSLQGAMRNGWAGPGQAPSPIWACLPKAPQRAKAETART